VHSPIELYLGQLRAKLERRFDSECADQLLSEIRAHLADSTAELQDEGVERLEAERVSISRFGAPERAAFLLPLGQQFGTGDRYWGRGAFWIAIVVALGLTWYAFSPFGGRPVSEDNFRPVTTLLLMFYAYACWRARSFAMVKHSAIVVGLIVMVTSLVRIQVVDPSIREVAGGAYEGVYAELGNSGSFGIGLSNLPFADLGKPFENLKMSVPDSAPPTLAPSKPRGDETSSKGLAIPGMAPLSEESWELTGNGALPEVSQLLLSWLFLILMTNAAVCWIGCLEHEQKGGVSLIQ
jgi:hypothetical protein